MRWYLIFLAFDGTMMIRNTLVCRYRRRLLDQVSRAAQVDIERHRAWMWRYDTFMAESYFGMVVRFWRRIDSFYPDRSFLDPDSPVDSCANR